MLRVSQVEQNSGGRGICVRPRPKNPLVPPDLRGRESGARECKAGDGEVTFVGVLPMTLTRHGKGARKVEFKVQGLGLKV